MRFLLDQNFDRCLARLLLAQGHDITIVAVNYPPGLSDSAVLAIAHNESRTLLSNDRDFGELTLREQLPHSGIIYPRLNRMSIDAKWDRLNQVLRDQADDLHRFLVVTESSVRIR